MKHFFFTVLVVFVITPAFTQKYEKISLKQLEEYGLFSLFVISNYPESLMPSQTSNAVIGLFYPPDNELNLLYAINDSIYLQETNSQLISSEDLDCRNAYAFYEDGKIKIESRFQSLISGLNLTVKNHQLSVVGEYNYDLNEEVYELIDQAQKDDDPVAYYHACEGLQFQWGFDYKGKECLTWAHKKAFKLYITKEYQKAADLMYLLDNECFLLKNERVEELFPAEFKRIW